MRLRVFGMIAVVLLVMMTPAAAQPTPRDQARCFTETGQCISGRIRAYWEQQGGLPVFGFPMTQAGQEVNNDTGQSYLTQWFERARLEVHPEHAAPYDVLLGRLGDEWLRSNGTDWQAQARESGPRPHCVWFAETGFNVCNQQGALGFATYWQSHGLRAAQLSPYQGSLALFGLPLSSVRSATNASGDRVLTQWFERARFEWHPDKPDQFKVLLGLLGSEVRTPFTPALTGKIAYETATPTTRQLAVLNLATHVTTSVTVPPADETQPAWSPDGQFLVYTASTGGQFDLYRKRQDGSNVQRLTDGQGTGGACSVDEQTFGRSSFDPAWSPDGQRIAFTGADHADNFSCIYVMDADGSHVMKLTADADVHLAAAPAWSPDGRQLAFSSSKGLSRMAADGTQQTLLLATTDVARHPAWSPDGRHIVFDLARADISELYVINSDGSNVTQLTSSFAGADDPVWSPDGAYILFGSARDAGSTLEVMPFEPEGAPARQASLAEHAPGSRQAWSAR